MITHLYVDKESGTYSDTLEAFGLARIAMELMERQGKRGCDVDIVDEGQYYRLDCIPGIDESNLEMLREQHIFPIHAIPTNQYDEGKQPENVPLVNWEDVSLYLASAKAGSGDGVTKPSHLDILLTINPEAIQGYNGLLFRLWNARKVQPEIFQLLLELYKNKFNDIDAALNTWSEIEKAKQDLILEDKGWKVATMITGQQIFNPVQGMGHSAYKLTDTLNWQSKPKINFWLVEWLRAIGFYELSLPQLVGDRDKRGDDKDRKILVLQPCHLSYSMNAQVLSKFRNTMLPETAIRFDLMAVLRYLKALLVHYVELIESDSDFTIEPIGRVTETLVSGFHIAFYKKMGRGRSLMNLSSISFPSWVEVSNEADVRFFLDLLDEFEKFIRQFREDDKKDKAYKVADLLQSLRDFVSGDDLTAFFQFSDAFPSYLMGKRERNQYARQLTTEFIERIVMSTEKSLSSIVENEGFQNIAYAIRQATVTAQYKKKQGDKRYDVRYGLGQELARKARYPQDFIAELSDFLHKYNAENAMVMENKAGPYRRSVQTSDINEIVRLIDVFGSKTVANLLIAYGHARVRRDEDTGEEFKEEEE